TGMIALAAAAFAAYRIRSARRGQARNARVERAGGSALLGKPAMEAAYWALEPLAAACERAGITANAVTGASLALGAAARAARALGHLGEGAALGGVAALCDALDGAVARRTGTASDGGEVLDAAVDRYQEFFFLAGLAVHYRADAVLLALVLSVLLG